MNLAQRLEVIIGGKDDGASRVIEGVKRSAQDAFGATGLTSFANMANLSIAGVVVGIGAAVTGLSALTVKVAAQGAAWKDMSDRTGISAEQLSALGYAADQSGTNIGAVEVGLKKLAVNMKSASDGNKELASTFRELDINTKTSDGSLRDVHDVLIDAADAISKMDNGAEQAALAVQLFGRSGTELLPLLKGGSEEIRNLEQRAKELGITFSDDAAAQADVLDDAIVELKASAQGLATSLGKELIPEATNVVSVFTDLADGANMAIKAIKGYSKPATEGGDLTIKWMKNYQQMVANIGPSIVGAGKEVEKYTASVTINVDKMVAEAGGKITEAMKKSQEEIKKEVAALLKESGKSSTGIKTEWDTLAESIISKSGSIKGAVKINFEEGMSSAATAILGVSGAWKVVGAQIDGDLDEKTGLPNKMKIAFESGSGKADVELEKIKGAWTEVNKAFSIDVSPIIKDLKSKWPDVKKDMEDTMSSPVFKVKLKPGATQEQADDFEQTVGELVGLMGPLDNKTLDKLWDNIFVDTYKPSIDETIKNAVDGMEVLPETSTKKLWDKIMPGEVLQEKVETDLKSLDFEKAWKDVKGVWGATAGTALQNGIIKSVGDAFGSEVGASAAVGMASAAGSAVIVTYGQWVVGKVLSGFGEALKISFKSESEADKNYRAWQTSQRQPSAADLAIPNNPALWYDTEGGAHTGSREEFADTAGKRYTPRPESTTPSGGVGVWFSEDGRPHTGPIPTGQGYFDSDPTLPGAVWHPATTPQPSPTPTPAPPSASTRMPGEDAAWARTVVRASAVGLSWDEGGAKSAIRLILGQRPDATPDQVVDALSDMSGGTPFAKGGMVDRPTRALIGEQGSEYVISNPGLRALDQLNSGDAQGFLGGNSKQVFIHVSINTPMDSRGIREFVQNDLGPIVREYLLRESERGVDIIYQNGVRAF